MEESKGEDLRETSPMMGIPVPKTDVLLSNIAGLKTNFFFYSQREIVLYSNGNFGFFKKKKYKGLKVLVEPKDIIKIAQAKNNLAIYFRQAGGQPNSLQFKFITKEEARGWLMSMDVFLR